MGKKWTDFYLQEEVINIPPLKKLELTGGVAWQIAVRGAKRYEVAVVQGERVVKESNSTANENIVCQSVALASGLRQ